ncbi:ultraviolet-B-repressible protein [Gossypium australe]|uniref:Ultraviolet-B-repressible protein n=1 Tax=Gossypium australe TaxID=47621 RepID=A0A5B6WXD5_9ROSI|nr:ultraviolet-B-repressible protein [Gossypium australe]
MASTSAASMALPLAGATQNRMPSSEAFFKPLPVKPWKAMGGVKRPNGKLQVKAGASSFKEKAVTGLTAAALTTSMMIPEVAQAADGVTPSLKNFLLSIAAGGVVLVAIVGAVIGVSNFDPEVIGRIVSLSFVFRYHEYTLDPGVVQRTARTPRRSWAMKPALRPAASTPKRPDFYFHARAEMMFSTLDNPSNAVEYAMAEMITNLKSSRKQRRK